jgi:hypothetical protein
MRVTRLFILVATAACSRGSTSGTLVDYANGRPIPGASVAARAGGWGISNRQLVWDRSYTSSARTDAEGRFTIHLPGPRPLVFGGTTLSVEADGYQRISDIVLPGGKPLLVQAMRSVPRAERVPGGMAYVGITESGERFGWSFARNRPVLDARDADIFLDDSASTLGAPITFSSTAPGGLLFLSRDQQRLASASYGMFLRYANDAPTDGYRSEVEIDTRGAGGTLFVRTTQGRFAKLAIVTPLSTMRGQIPVRGLPERAAWALPLPFAYNPFPGRSLAYDPSEPSGILDPAVAGAAAELPESGEPERGARRYRITVEDSAGTPIDSAIVTLTPGIPVTSGNREGGGYRFSNILLTYGERGLAAVRLSIESPAAVYHTADIIPNSRFAIANDFHDYSTDGKPLPRILRIVEKKQTADSRQQ